MTGAADDARRALEAIVARLPAGEARPGQLEMCSAVAEALAGGRHLVVEAGTGVGKSLAYLVPAVLSGRRVVVATARKPLQDQLIRKDIPFLDAALPGKVDAAVLKGRSNYLCLAKLDEALGGGDGQAQLSGLGNRRLRAALERLRDWADATPSGDLAEAPVAVDAALAGLVTVSARECPGAAHCPRGDDCLAVHAVERARQARLVVTNIDLYCFDAAARGGVLGEHDAVVIDEAHELEAVATRTFGLELGRRRLVWLAGQLRSLLTRGADEPARVEAAGDQLEDALAGFAGREVEAGTAPVAAALVAADAAVAQALEVVRRLPASADRTGARRPRVLQAASSLLGDLRGAQAPRDGDVAWVPDGDDPVLRVAPVDVGPTLDEFVYTRHTAVLTSATLSVGGDVEPLAQRLGLRAPGGHTALRVASPFRYREQARLYCARHLPDPRRSGFDEAALAELGGLVEAAGGRTLALFTSHRMLRLAAERLRDRFAWPVLVQEGAPTPALLEQFRDDERACLLATMGFWQGVDVPGPSLSLVAMDRLPFPSPRDPLLAARRRAAEQDGQPAFEAVDLPIAATLLAQGAGRLIRTTTDRGVVAVLDRRLAVARYRPALLASLPPMHRTVDGDEVRRFLSSLAAERPPAGNPAPAGGRPR